MSSLNSFIASALVVFLLSESAAFANVSSRPDSAAFSKPFNAAIPDQWGRVEEKSQGRSGKNIIYIQDAHDSLEAQENIAALITYLTKEQGVKTVYEEGWQGTVPTDDFFGRISDSKIRRAVSYFFLDKLRIGGAEFAHINRSTVDSRRTTVERQSSGQQKKSRGLLTVDRGQDFNLIGADNIKLHLENIAQYQKAAKVRQTLERDLEAVDREIQVVIQKRFPKEVKKWLRLKDRYEMNQLGLLDYLKRTIELLKVNAVNGQGQRAEGNGTTPFAIPPVPTAEKEILKFPHIDLLIEAEKTRNESLVNRVKAADTQDLFQEVSALETSVSEKFLIKKEDQQLFRYNKTLRLLRRLGRMEVTSAELGAAKKDLSNLNSQELADFLAKETRKPVLLSRRWEYAIRKALEFYELAEKRDIAMKETLNGFLSNPKENTAILVFGGFHKDSIREFFHEKDISYTIVTPKISAPDPKHQKYYKMLMAGGAYPYEIKAENTPALHASRNLLLWHRPEQAQVEIDHVLASVLRRPENAEDLARLELDLSRTRPQAAGQLIRTQQRSEARRLPSVSETPSLDPDLQPVLTQYDLGEVKKITPTRTLPDRNQLAQTSAVIEAENGKFFLRSHTYLSGSGKFNVSLQSLIYQTAFINRVRDYGIPAAVPIKTLGGGISAKTEDADFTLWEFIEGNELADLLYHEEHLRLLGTAAAAIQKATQGWHPEKGKPFRDEYPRLYVDYAKPEDSLARLSELKRKLDSRIDSGIADSNQKIFVNSYYPLLINQGELLKRNLPIKKYEKLPRSIIHGDITLKNAVFLNGKIRGFFDFEHVQEEARVAELSMIFPNLTDADVSDANLLMARFKAYCGAYQSALATDQKMSSAEVSAIQEMVRGRLIRDFLWMADFLESDMPYYRENGQEGFEFLSKTMKKIAVLLDSLDGLDWKAFNRELTAAAQSVSGLNPFETDRGEIKNVADRWREAWDKKILEGKESEGKSLARKSRPFIEIDPRKLEKGRAGVYHTVIYPKVPGKNGFSVSREQIAAGGGSENLMPNMTVQWIKTDVWTPSIRVIFNRWPAAPYDSMLVSNEPRPQILTREMIRAQIQWGYRGAFSEFHRADKFVNHLHVHIRPVQFEPIWEYRKHFQVRESSGGLRLGALAGYPFRHFAFASKDPDAAEAAADSLIQKLQGEDVWFQEGSFVVPETGEIIFLVIPFQKKQKGLDLRTSGTIKIPDKSWQDENRLRVALDEMFLPQGEINQIAEKWWGEWKKNFFSPTEVIEGPETDQDLTQEKLNERLNRWRKEADGRIPFERGPDGLDPDFVVFYHGRFAPLKNLTVFIKTVARLAGYFQRSGKTLRVVMAGGTSNRHSPYEAYLKELIKVEGLENVIDLYGSYDAAQLPEIYGQYPRESSLFLFTGENESFGLAPLEALRLGVPVAASANDAVREVIQGPREKDAAGIVVDVEGKTLEEKVLEYYTAVLKLIQDPYVLKVYRDQAKPRSLRFRPETMANQYAAIFQGVTGKEGGVVEYRSPGLFPYSEGGVPQWARNLIRYLPANWKVNVVALQPKGAEISWRNQQSLAQAGHFVSVKQDPTRETEVHDSKVKESFRELVARILKEPASGDYARRFETPTDGKNPQDILFLLHQAAAQGLGEEKLGKWLREILAEEDPVWAESLNEEQWGIFKKAVFEQGHYFDFLRAPLSEEEDLTMIDSPHPFEISGLLAKYYSESGARKIPRPYLFIQHSRGSKAVYEKIQRDSKLSNESKAVLLKFHTYFLKLLFEHADITVAVSHEVGEEAVQTFRANPERLKVIYNGIDFGLTELGTSGQSGGRFFTRSEMRGAKKNEAIPLSREEALHEARKLLRERAESNRYSATPLESLYLDPRFEGIKFDLWMYGLAHANPAVRKDLANNVMPNSTIPASVYLEHLKKPWVSFEDFGLPESPREGDEYRQGVGIQMKRIAILWAMKQSLIAENPGRDSFAKALREALLRDFKQDEELWKRENREMISRWTDEDLLNGLQAKKEMSFLSVLRRAVLRSQVLREHPNPNAVYRPWVSQMVEEILYQITSMQTQEVKAMILATLPLETKKRLFGGVEDRDEAGDTQSPVKRSESRGDAAEEPLGGREEKLGESDILAERLEKQLGEFALELTAALRSTSNNQSQARSGISSEAAEGLRREYGEIVRLSDLLTDNRGFEDPLVEKFNRMIQRAGRQLDRVETEQRGRSEMRSGVPDGSGTDNEEAPGVERLQFTRFEIPELPERLRDYSENEIPETFRLSKINSDQEWIQQYLLAKSTDEIPWLSEIAQIVKNPGSAEWGRNFGWKEYSVLTGLPGNNERRAAFYASLLGELAKDPSREPALPLKDSRAGSYLEEVAKYILKREIFKRAGVDISTWKGEQLWHGFGAHYFDVTKGTWIDSWGWTLGELWEILNSPNKEKSDWLKAVLVKEKEMRTSFKAFSHLLGNQTGITLFREYDLDYLWRGVSLLRELTLSESAEDERRLSERDSRLDFGLITQFAKREKAGMSLWDFNRPDAVSQLHWIFRLNSYAYSQNDRKAEERWQYFYREIYQPLRSSVVEQNVMLNDLEVLYLDYKNKRISNADAGKRYASLELKSREINQGLNGRGLRTALDSTRGALWRLAEERYREEVEAVTSAQIPKQLQTYLNGGSISSTEEIEAFKEQAAAAFNEVEKRRAEISEDYPFMRVVDKKQIEKFVSRQRRNYNEYLDSERQRLKRVGAAARIEQEEQLARETLEKIEKQLSRESLEILFEKTPEAVEPSVSAAMEEVERVISWLFKNNKSKLKHRKQLKADADRLAEKVDGLRFYLKTRYSWTGEGISSINSGEYSAKVRKLILFFLVTPAQTPILVRLKNSEKAPVWGRYESVYFTADHRLRLIISPAVHLGFDVDEIESVQELAAPPQEAVRISAKVEFPETLLRVLSKLAGRKEQDLQSPAAWSGLPGPLKTKLRRLGFILDKMQKVKLTSEETMRLGSQLWETKTEDNGGGVMIQLPAEVDVSKQILFEKYFRSKKRFKILPDFKKYPQKKFIHKESAAELSAVDEWRAILTPADFKGLMALPLFLFLPPKVVSVLYEKFEIRTFEGWLHFTSEDLWKINSKEVSSRIAAVLAEKESFRKKIQAAAKRWGRGWEAGVKKELKKIKPQSLDQRLQELDLPRTVTLILRQAGIQTIRDLVGLSGESLNHLGLGHPVLVYMLLGALREVSRSSRSLNDAGSTVDPQSASQLLLPVSAGQKYFQEIEARWRFFSERIAGVPFEKRAVEYSKIQKKAEDEVGKMIRSGQRKTASVETLYFRLIREEFSRQLALNLSGVSPDVITKLLKQMGLAEKNLLVSAAPQEVLDFLSDLDSETAAKALKALRYPSGTAPSPNVNIWGLFARSKKAPLEFFVSQAAFGFWGAGMRVSRIAKWLGISAPSGKKKSRSRALGRLTGKGRLEAVDLWNRTPAIAISPADDDVLVGFMAGLVSNLNSRQVALAILNGEEKSSALERIYGSRKGALYWRKITAKIFRMVAYESLPKYGYKPAEMINKLKGFLADRDPLSTLDRDEFRRFYEASENPDPQQMLEILTTLFPDLGSRLIRQAVKIKFGEWAAAREEKKKSAPQESSKFELESVNEAVQGILKMLQIGGREALAERLYRESFYGKIRREWSLNGSDAIAAVRGALQSLPEPENEIFRDIFLKNKEFYSRGIEFRPDFFRSETPDGTVEPLRLDQILSVWEQKQKLEKEPHGVLNAGEARTGKTIPSVLAQLNVKDQKGKLAVRKILYTTSKTAMYEVKHELERRLDPEIEVFVIDGQTKKDRQGEIRKANQAAEKGRRVVLISSYDRTFIHAEELKGFAPDGHIIDEVEHLKGGRRVKKAPVIFGIPARYRTAISARFAINKLEEAAAPLAWIYSPAEAVREQERFEISLQKKNEKDFLGLLDAVTVRWRLKTVLPDLPKVHEHVVKVPLSRLQEETVRKMRENFQAFLAEDASANIKDYEPNLFNRIRVERMALLDLRLVLKESRVKDQPLDQLAPKLVKLREMAAEEFSRSGKALIFSDVVDGAHQNISDYLNKEFTRDAAKTLSGMTPKSRDALIQAFRGETAPWFLIGSHEIMGSSLNLFQLPNRTFHTAAVFVINDSFRPFDDGARLIGPGQTFDVNVYRMVSASEAFETVDERLLKLVRSKKKMLRTAADGKADLRRNAKKSFEELFPGNVTPSENGKRSEVREGTPDKPTNIAGLSWRGNVWTAAEVRETLWTPPIHSSFYTKGYYSILHAIIETRNSDFKPELFRLVTATKSSLVYRGYALQALLAGMNPQNLSEIEKQYFDYIRGFISRRYALSRRDGNALFYNQLFPGILAEFNRFMKDPENFKILEAGLRSKSSKVRAMVIDSLGESGGAEAKQLLENFRENEKIARGERSKVSRAIKRIEKRLSKTEEKNPEARSESRTTLAEKWAKKQKRFIERYSLSGSIADLFTAVFSELPANASQGLRSTSIGKLDKLLSRSRISVEDLPVVIRLAKASLPAERDLIISFLALFLNKGKMTRTDLTDKLLPLKNKAEETFSGILQTLYEMIQQNRERQVSELAAYWEPFLGNGHKEAGAFIYGVGQLILLGEAERKADRKYFSEAEAAAIFPPLVKVHPDLVLIDQDTLIELIEHPNIGKDKVKDFLIRYFGRNPDGLRSETLLEMKRLLEDQSWNMEEIKKYLLPLNQMAGGAVYQMIDNLRLAVEEGDLRKEDIVPLLSPLLRFFGAQSDDFFYFWQGFGIHNIVNRLEEGEEPFGGGLSADTNELSLAAARFFSKGSAFSEFAQKYNEGLPDENTISRELWLPILREVDNWLKGDKSDYFVEGFLPGFSERFAQKIWRDLELNEEKIRAAIRALFENDGDDLVKHSDRIKTLIEASKHGMEVDQIRRALEAYFGGAGVDEETRYLVLDGIEAVGNRDSIPFLEEIGRAENYSQNVRSRAREIIRDFSSRSESRKSKAKVPEALQLADFVLTGVYDQKELEPYLGASEGKTFLVTVTRNGKKRIFVTFALKNKKTVQIALPRKAASAGEGLNEALLVPGETQALVRAEFKESENGAAGRWELEVSFPSVPGYPSQRFYFKDQGLRLIKDEGLSLSQSKKLRIQKRTRLRAVVDEAAKQAPRINSLEQFEKWYGSLTPEQLPDWYREEGKLSVKAAFSALKRSKKLVREFKIRKDYFVKDYLDQHPEVRRLEVSFRDDQPVEYWKWFFEQDGRRNFPSGARGTEYLSALSAAWVLAGAGKVEGKEQTFFSRLDAVNYVIEKKEAFLREFERILREYPKPQDEKALKELFYGHFDQALLGLRQFYFRHAGVFRVPFRYAYEMYGRQFAEDFYKNTNRSESRELNFKKHYLDLDVFIAAVYKKSEVQENEFRFSTAQLRDWGLKSLQGVIKKAEKRGWIRFGEYQNARSGRGQISVYQLTDKGQQAAKRRLAKKDLPEPVLTDLNHSKVRLSLEDFIVWLADQQGVNLNQVTAPEVEKQGNPKAYYYLERAVEAGFLEKTRSLKGSAARYHYKVTEKSKRLLEHKKNGEARSENREPDGETYLVISNQMPVWYFLRAFGFDPEKSSIETSREGRPWGTVHLPDREDSRKKALQSAFRVMISEEWMKKDYRLWVELERIQKSGDAESIRSLHLLTYNGVPAAIVWPVSNYGIYYSFLNSSNGRFFSEGLNGASPQYSSHSNELKAYMRRYFKTFDVTANPFYDDNAVASPEIHTDIIHHRPGASFPSIYLPGQNTTQTLVAVFGSIDFKSKTVAEVGSGNGRAVVEAVKQGAAKGIGYEISALGRENTAYWAAVNGVSDKVEAKEELADENYEATDIYLFDCPNIESGEAEAASVDLPNYEQARQMNLSISSEIFNSVMRRVADSAKDSSRFYLRVGGSREALAQFLVGSGWEISRIVPHHLDQYESQGQVFELVKKNEAAIVPEKENRSEVRQGDLTSERLARAIKQLNLNKNTDRQVLWAAFDGVEALNHELLERRESGVAVDFKLLTLVRSAVFPGSFSGSEVIQGQLLVALAEAGKKETKPDLRDLFVEALSRNVFFESEELLKVKAQYQDLNQKRLKENLDKLNQLLTAGRLWRLVAFAVGDLGDPDNVLSSEAGVELSYLLKAGYSDEAHRILTQERWSFPEENYLAISIWLEGDLHQPSARSESRSKKLAENNARPDVRLGETEIVLVDFKELSGYSPQQIEEIIFQSESRRGGTRVLVYNFDSSLSLARVFSSRRSSRLVLSRAGLLETASKYVKPGFKGNVIHLSASVSLSAEALKKQIGDNVWFVSYNGDAAGILAVTLRDLKDGALRTSQTGELVKPGYFAQDSHSRRLFLPDSSAIEASGAAAFETFYRSLYAFSSAA